MASGLMIWSTIMAARVQDWHQVAGWKLWGHFQSKHWNVCWSQGSQESDRLSPVLIASRRKRAKFLRSTRFHEGSCTKRLFMAVSNDICRIQFLCRESRMIWHWLLTEEKGRRLRSVLPKAICHPKSYFQQPAWKNGLWQLTVLNWRLFGVLRKFSLKRYKSAQVLRLTKWLTAQCASFCNNGWRGLRTSPIWHFRI